MGVKSTIYHIPMTSIDSSTLSGSYQAINTGGTPQACTIFKIINNSTVDVTISFDPTLVAGGDFAPSKSFAIIDAQAAKQPENDLSTLAQGTTVYVKGSAGVGSIYLVGYYQPKGN